MEKDWCVGSIFGNQFRFLLTLLDKLQFMFPAGLSHDTWHELDIVDDAMKGSESCVSFLIVAHRKYDPRYTFPCQTNEKA